MELERNSILYKIRRKGQVVAHRIFSNEFMSKLYFKIVLRKNLNLENPQSFNEKIQWLKLYYFPRNKTIINCADKYAVREYVKGKGYTKKLVPLIGVWDKTDDIEWDKLPKQFVLKCNHGCAYNIVVPDKNKSNKIVVKKQLNKWLKEDFGAFNIELHYSCIKHHRIICEEFLGENITDYKFFCFNGKPHCIYVSTDLIHDRKAQIGFFYLDGTKMPLHRDDYTDITEVTLPDFFEEMRYAAEVLSADFPFVRVDFFIANNTWYFAELTFTPGAGMMPFNPDSFDLEWGRRIKLPIKRRRVW